MGNKAIFLIVFIASILPGALYCISFTDEQVPSTLSSLEIFSLAKDKVSNGAFDEGQILYLKALPMLLADQRHAERADALIDLAVMYHWKDSIGLGFQCLFKAKNIIEKELGTDSELYGTCLTNLSAFYYSKRQVTEGLQFEQKALSILENVNYDRTFVAQLLTNIALTKDVLGDYGGAIDHLERALSYLQDPNPGSLLLNCEVIYYLGLMYKNLKAYDKAIKQFHRSKKLVIELPRATDVERLHIQLLQRLADCYLQLNNSAQAHALLSQALDIQHGDSSYRKYLSMEIKADILSKSKKLEEAKLFAKEAIRLSKITHANFQNHPVIARQCTHLGETIPKLNNASLNTTSSAPSAEKPELCISDIKNPRISETFKQAWRLTSSHTTLSKNSRRISLPWAPSSDWRGMPWKYTRKPLRLP